MKKILMFMVSMLSITSASTFAAPAPWYYWKSRIDGVLVCAQNSLGEGWKRDSGPYQDAQCSKLRIIKLDIVKTPQ